MSVAVDTSGDMPIHPAAAALPLLTGDAFTALVEDIKANGLRFALTTFQGQLLDGRNRLNACLVAGVSPRFKEYKGDSPTSFVVSVNLRRRQLTAPQLAAFAVDPAILASYKAEAKARQEASGGNRKSARSVRTEPVQTDNAPFRAVTESAKAFNVGRDSAHHMQHVQRVAPDVYEAAKRGEIPSVAEAVRRADEVAERRDPRSAARDTRDAEIATLAKDDGLATHEIAGKLGVSKGTVNDAKRRLGLVPKHDNPLRKLTDFVTEAEDTMQLALKNGSKFADATPEHITELVTHLRALRQGAYSLIRKLTNQQQEE